MIIISIIGFIIGLYNYINIKYNDAYIKKNGGGETIGIIITKPKIQSYTYSNINKNIIDKTYYNLDFMVSYNINNIKYEKGYKTMIYNFISIDIMKVSFVLFIIFKIIYIFFAIIKKKFL